mmetsp:Transcript_11801/g.36882  ORF Transcript_11801/g.36882 Transcript_11801/m.36882 type:complete len:220 (-) Transcript_11801:106-765(-)
MPSSLRLSVAQLLHQGRKQCVVVGNCAQGHAQRGHGDRHRVLAAVGGGHLPPPRTPGLCLRVVHDGWDWSNNRLRRGLCRTAPSFGLCWHGFRLRLCRRGAHLLKCPLQGLFDLLALTVVMEPQATDALGRVLHLVEYVVLLTIELPIWVQHIEEVIGAELILDQELVPRSVVTVHQIDGALNVCFAPAGVGSVLLQEVGHDELRVDNNAVDLGVLLLQ